MKLKKRLKKIERRFTKLSNTEQKEVLSFCRETLEDLEEDIQEDKSYRNLHITTSIIGRTSILNFPYRVRVLCSRDGWEVWAITPVQGKWLVLDVGQ